MTNLSSDHGTIRLDAVEKRVISLDENISSIASYQAADRATLSTLVQSVNRIGERLDKPMNTWGMVSSVVALIVVMGAGVTMRVAPIEAATVLNALAVEALQVKANEHDVANAVALTTTRFLEKENDRDYALSIRVAKTAPTNPD
jgi:hypothetical protein